VRPNPVHIIKELISRHFIKGIKVILDLANMSIFKNKEIYFPNIVKPLDSE